MGLLLLALGCGVAGSGPGAGEGEPGATAEDSAADTAPPDTAGDSGEEVQAPPYAGMHLLAPLAALGPAEAQAELVSGLAASRGSLAVNPSDGPGTARDGSWGALFSAGAAAGVPVVGFVPTEGGARDGDDVARELGRYVAWYDGAGVWLSTSGASACSAVAAYTEAAGHADSADADKDALVVIQSDLDCPELLDAADVVVVAAESASAFGARAARDWMGAESPERFAAWVWEADAAALPGVFEHARELGIGHVYVTDAPEAAAFTTLPTYWADEVALIAR